MTLMTLVRDVDSNSAVFAIIAQDDGADYLFPEHVEPWLSEERVVNLAELQDAPPTNESGWLELASRNLGRVAFDKPTKFSDVDLAIAEADKELENFVPLEADRHRLDAASEAFDTVSADYPGFMESEEDTSAEALDHYVMQALGPIDPQGPNGWILRAQEGKPLPGDEDQYIHWPGAPLADDVQSLNDDNPDLEFELNTPAPEPDDETSEPVPDNEQTEEPE